MYSSCGVFLCREIKSFAYTSIVDYLKKSGKNVAVLQELNEFRAK